MKGLVFNELLEMIEQQHGLEVLERTLAQADSEGVYVAVNAYDHREFHQLVHACCALTGVPVACLLVEFGRRMFASLVARFPAFADKCRNGFDLLERLDGEIHAEVLKLYPDADLPAIQVSPLGAEGLRVRYASHRRLADFAQGMIEGCFAHFGDPVSVQRHADDPDNPDEAVFDVRRGAGTP